MSGTAGHRGSEVATKQEFVRLTASNAMFEVEAAKLVQERSRDERERRFAQDMSAARGKATEELRGLLRNTASLHGVQMPGQMAEQYQTWLSQLRAAEGDNSRCSTPSSRRKRISSPSTCFATTPRSATTRR